MVLNEKLYSSWRAMSKRINALIIVTGDERNHTAGHHEDNILPGPRRIPYPGLVLEAARLLYVSITRARAACVVSYASRRRIRGILQPQTASRFTANLGGPFLSRMTGFSALELEQIVSERAQLY